jgi:hypothetical protein
MTQQTPTRIAKGATILDTSATVGLKRMVIVKITRETVDLQPEWAITKGYSPAVSGFDTVPVRLFWRRIEKGFYRVEEAA